MTEKHRRSETAPEAPADDIESTEPSQVADPDLSSDVQDEHMDDERSDDR